MAEDIAALVAQADLPAIAAAFTELKQRGSEFVGRCVFHSPDAHPSLSLYRKNGKWNYHCWSCGEQGDALDWIEKLEGLDTVAALKRLNGGTQWKPVAPTRTAPAPLPDRITSKPPEGIASPHFTIRLLGEPELIFPLKDLDGSLMGYECRYKGPDGRKEIRVWSYGARGHAPPSWGCGHFNVPRPLYGLERLAELPEVQVQIFEGPKKADAGRRLLAGMPCLSWTGGAQAWAKHNWRPLRGRKVLLWPDADEPGWTACEKLAALLADPRGLACEVRMVDSNRMPEGWDVADAEAEGWDGAKLREWAKGRAKDWKAPEEPPPQPPSDAAGIEATDMPPEPGTSSERPKRSKPRLAAVDGNAALARAPDIEPQPQAMSEDALADHFATQHCERWRYVKPWGSWFEWRGDGWYRDDTAKIDRLAVELTRQALEWSEAGSLTLDAKRKVNSRRTAGSVRDLALHDRRIAARVDQWDTDPWLLGVPGGVVDLRSGEHSAARSDQYITKRTRVAPVGTAAPLWTQFLHTVMDDNERMISFLQRFSGYALTGETREQSLAFLYGTGQNGKGVFIATISNILGDYASAADADVFMESDSQRHPTEMARLRGARLVHVDETDSSKRWNERRIKRITGGGTIEAHFMRQDDFEFVPQFKLLIAGNHKPQLRGVGKAMQRRIHLVPFTVTIPDDQCDDELAQKLQPEYPVILQWMIEGCISWRKLGLAPPAEVIDATSRYLEAEDIIGEWLDERTEQRGETERPNAYKNYRAWAEGRGERAWSSKAFSAVLEERGFVMRKSNGVWRVTGMSLKLGQADPSPYS